MEDNTGFGIPNKNTSQRIHPECLASGSSKFFSVSQAFTLVLFFSISGEE